MNSTLFSAVPRRMARTQLGSDCGSPTHQKIVGIVVNNFATKKLSPDKFGFMNLISEFPLLRVMVMLSVSVTLGGILICICQKMCCKGYNVRKSGRRSIRTRKKKRKWLGVLLLILIAASGFGLWIAIVCSVKLRQYSVNTFSWSRTFLDDASDQINHVLIQNYEEFEENFKHLLDSFIAGTLTQFRESVNSIRFKKTENFLWKRSEVEALIANIEDDVNELRLTDTQLNDDMRIFYRNETMLLKMSDPGKFVLLASNFKYFKTKILELHALTPTELVLKNLQLIIHEISRHHIASLRIPHRISNEVKKIFLNSSENIKRCINSNGNNLAKQYRAIKRVLENARNTDDSTDKVSLVLCNGGLVVCLVICLILISLLAAVLPVFCSRCNTATLLSRTVYVIIWLYAAIASIACLHFSKGVELHNSICTKQQSASMAAELTVFGKRSLPFKPSIFSDCTEHKTVYTIFQSRNVIEDISVSPKVTNDINILVKNLVDEISNISYKDGYLKDSQKMVAEAKQVATKFKKGQICVAIQGDLNLTYLRSVHDKISEYVTNQLTNDEPGPFAGQSRRDLIVCNLNYLRDNIINKMIVSEMLVKIGNVVKNCRQIAALFSDDIDIDIQTYFNKTDEMLNFYDDEFNSFLVSVQDGLMNLYEEHFENYMNMANDALKTKIGLCDFAPKSLIKGANSSRCVCLAFLLNGFWVGVFLVLFAFLPIIFLGYLWACCMRKSAKIKHTPDSRNISQAPRSGYGCSLDCRDESCVCPHIPISGSTPCICAYDGYERASYSRNQLT